MHVFRSDWYVRVNKLCKENTRNRREEKFVETCEFYSLGYLYRCHIVGISLVEILHRPIITVQFPFARQRPTSSLGASRPQVRGLDHFALKKEKGDNRPTRFKKKKAVHTCCWRFCFCFCSMSWRCCSNFCCLRLAEGNESILWRRTFSFSVSNCEEDKRGLIARKESKKEKK